MKIISLFFVNTLHSCVKKMSARQTTLKMKKKMRQFIKLKRLNKSWLIVYLFVKVFLSQILLAQSLLWNIAIIGKESVGMTTYFFIIKFYFLFDNYISFLFKVFILQVFINSGPSMSSMICVFTYPRVLTVSMSEFT